MKKQNPIYLFITLLSIGMTGFAVFFIISPFGMTSIIMMFVFFGIISLFILSIAKKLTTNSFGELLEKFKECHNCKTVIPSKSAFCPNCGVNLREDMVICEYCDHVNKKGAVICENCNGLIG